MPKRSGGKSPRIPIAHRASIALLLKQLANKRATEGLVVMVAVVVGVAVVVVAVTMVVAPMDRWMAVALHAGASLRIRPH